MAVARKMTRSKKADAGGTRVVKDKFLDERKVKIQSKPLVPMNDRQREYIQLIEDKPVVIATGFAGTSKTYIPTVLAADLYKLNQIEKIYITRPAVSSSKSVGYNKGTFLEKLTPWLGGVIPIFQERLGKPEFEISLEAEDITFVPMETIKGMSINNAWLLVEEASDLTKDELIKIITRMGKNSKLIISGDVRQSELNSGSGMLWLIDFVKRHNLSKNYGFIDFNDVNDIVRSSAVKEFIVAMVRDEKKGMQECV